MEYRLLIETLAYSIISIEKPPTGCAIVTVTDKVQVHLLLKVIITTKIDKNLMLIYRAP